VGRTRKSSKWYVDFFREGFYQRWAPAERFERTDQEVEFIVQVLGLPVGAPILDLCCGEGRHTVALAQRGYQMSGLDLSSLQLRLARRAAKEAGVDVRWHRADMRNIPWEGEFDGVINMFTSFGYLGSDEEDFNVLQGVARALKPGGRFLLDTINREWLMRHGQERGWQEGADGTLYLEERRFDFLAGRQRRRVLAILPDGTRDEREIDLRNYTLTELTAMLLRAGLRVQNFWGGYRGREYGLDTRRMIVLAEKGVHNDGEPT
jgi:SAM-dependent methyltransferase